jgi:FAD-linked oxidoreductase
MSEPSDPQHGAHEWRNWAGDERCKPAVVRRPASTEELSSALVEAAREGLRVRVVGAGHSFSDIARAEGMMISLERMNLLLDVDRDSGLVRVQAGITIHELHRRLAPLGLAMENLGDIDVQSIAGAISTATHGTGARLRNISSQVTGLSLVLADGSTLECSEEIDPETFRAARVGLGALGVLSEITLRCVPAFTLHGRDAPASLADVLERFETLALENDHFEFFVFPHADVALTRTNNRTSEAPRPRSRTSAYLNDIVLTNHAFGAFCRIGRRFPRAIPSVNRLVTRVAGSSERVDDSAAIFASPRLVRFTEMEYALPREQTPLAVRRVMSEIERRGFAVPFPVEVRTVAPDDAFLSTAHGRESGFVAVHMFEGMEWEPYFRAVEQVMDELGGRPHWGKRHFQTAQTLRGRYPDWDRFIAVRDRLDPGGRFANDWTDRVLGPAHPTAHPTASAPPSGAREGAAGSIGSVDG